MDAKDRVLTPREQAYFEHARQAKEQGLTLKAYCEKVGMNVQRLYDVRRVLGKKGVVPRAPVVKTKQRDTRPSPFVAVRVAPAGLEGAEAVCRVRHPSGWVIECGRWPEAAWVSELLKGGGDAAA